MFMLHPDWRLIIRHAWSVRFIGFAAIFSMGEVALPIIQPYVPLNPIWLGVGAGASAGAAFVSRIIAQKEFRDLNYGP
jgi:hypothetical protein